MVLVYHYTSKKRNIYFKHMIFSRLTIYEMCLSDKLQQCLGVCFWPSYLSWWTSIPPDSKDYDKSDPWGPNFGKVCPYKNLYKMSWTEQCLIAKCYRTPIIRTLADYQNVLNIGSRRCKCNELALVMWFINPETDYVFASIFHTFESQVHTSTALRTNGCLLK